jgi:glycosyltransferase involved in cell wall biosynthesis
MKIFYITHTFSLNGGGGGEIACGNLLKELSRQGHEILVFTPHSNEPSAEEKEFKIKVYRAPAFGHHAFHKYCYLLSLGEAMRLAEEFRPDIVHGQNDVLPGLIAHRIKKKLGVPFVLGLEYISRENASLNMKVVYWLNRLLVKRLNWDVIVSMSNFNAEKYLIPWGVPAEKIKVVPNSVKSDLLKPGKPQPELIEKYGRHLLISLKPLHNTNVEGLKIIVEAMKYVAEKHPEYKYLIYGGGTGRKSLKDLIAELGLEKNVFLLDEHIPYEQLPEIYNSAEILPHSFVFEATTSMGLLDSLACGKAIVATDIGEVKQVAGEAALLVKPKDAKAFAQGINRLIENPALRKALEGKARRQAEKNFSVRASADKLGKIYKKLKEGRGKVD